MADTEVKVIKYLDHEGLVALWEKISNTYLRNANVVDALTKFGDGYIIATEDGTFIQKGTFDWEITGLKEKIEEIESAQGTNIDNDTIINVDGLLQTDLLLQNDKDNHVLSIVTGKGTEVSSWDYTDFYNEAVKDGFLKDVSLVVIPGDETTESSGQAAGTYLKFIWNIDADKDASDGTTEKVTYVDVTDLIDIYNGSTYINIDKENGTSTISLNHVAYADWLKTDEALGIDSIITRIEGVETDIDTVKELVQDLQNSWDSIDLTALQEQVADNKANIETIFTILEKVPNTPITIQEINDLDNPI